MGNLLMLIGGLLLVLGALVRFAPGLFAWFGHLPGDIRIEGEGTRVLIPITSMIVLSIAVTLVFNLFGWLFRDR